MSKSPDAADKTDGALTVPTFITIADELSRLNTATMVSSMPFRLPWLSNIGTVINTRKFASGGMTCTLLLGVMYGSAGTIITEFAVITLGGYAKMFQTPALVRAVASVERRVVSAVVIYPTIEFGLMYGAIRPRIDAIKVLDILNGLGLNPSTLMPPSWVVCLD